MLKYLPLLLLVGALAFVSVPNTDEAGAAVPSYVTTGGWFTQPPTMIVDPGNKVTFGGVLQCDAPFDQPNQLIVHYTGTLSNVPGDFNLEAVTSATCTLNNPNDPQSGGRWEGTGVGRCNGGPATALFIQFNDAGHGNPGDNARFTINGPAQGCAFAVFATLLEGGQITLHAD